MAIVFHGVMPGFESTPGVSETYRYLFRSTDHRDRSIDVQRNRYCPRPGMQHPSNNFMFLKRDDLTITQSSGNEWFKWEVEARFTALEPGEPKPEEEQPNAQPAESEQPDFQPHVTIHYEDYSAPLEFAKKAGVYDADSKAGLVPVVNSALEPYETPPEIFKQNTIIRITRNLSLRSSIWKDVKTLKNTINTDTYTFKRGTFKETVGPYMGRMKFNIGDQVEYRDKNGKERQYANLECQIVVNPETWKVDILDYGTYQLSTAGKTIAQRITDDDWALAGGTTKQPFKDEEKDKIYELLDGTGRQLGTGDNSFFNRYDGYEETKHKAFFKRITKRV